MRLGKPHEPAGAAMSDTMPGRNGGQLKRGGSPGRRKGSVSLVSALRRQLTQKDADGVAAIDRVAAALIEQAAAGNVAAIREIMSRLDGTVPGRLDVRQLSRHQLEYLAEQRLLDRPDAQVIRVVFGDDDPSLAQTWPTEDNR
jgi:hypothetical protein